MEKEIKLLDKRITLLEEHRENDLEKINDNNIKLTEILAELKIITHEINEISANWEKTIKENKADTKEEHNAIDNKILVLESNLKKLENELHERTINKDAETLNKIKWQIVTLVLTAIVSGIISMAIKFD